MKVLHVLRSEAWGGLEIYTLSLIEKLRQSGLDCELLCRQGSKLDLEAQQKNIPVRYALFTDLSSWTAIHVHRRQDLLLCRLSLIGRRKIKFFYSLYMNAPPKKDLYHKWIYSRINGMMSSSELLNEKIRQNFPVDPQKVHLVRYGKDLTQKRLSPAEIFEFKNKNGFATNKFIIGTMCRLDPGKGVGELADSLSYLSNEELAQLELWIVGDPTLLRINPDGSRVDHPESEILLKKLKVIQQDARYSNVLRLISFQRDFRPVLSSMDVFVLATHKDETYSLAVIDALSLGIGLIGTEEAGTIEQIGSQQERGLFIKPKSSESIAAAIRNCLNNPQILETRGKAGFQWATREHNWDTTIKKIKQIYARA